MFMRNGTRVVASLLGRLLADDMAEVEQEMRDPDQKAVTAEMAARAALWRAEAEAILNRFDKLDDWDDPAVDPARTEAVLGSELWLQLAEEGALDPEYVAHVLHRASDGQYGYAPGRFVASLLTTIDRADQENRDALSLAFPEYVGLWSAVLCIPETEARLVRSLERAAS